MALDRTAVRNYLRTFQFKALFTQELGWDNLTGTLAIAASGVSYNLQIVAEKSGVVVLALRTQEGIPPYAIRRKIEGQVTKRYHEHLIIFTDGMQEQIWQWVRREIGKPLACREHRFDVDNSGEALIQRLEALVYGWESYVRASVTDAAHKLESAFDVERVTKRFYEQFKKEHAAFRKTLRGVTDGEQADWYVSVMLNRLMFIYFIQKKGFLNDDADYLAHRLKESRQAGEDRFYWAFLRPLFFEGFARPEPARSPELRAWLGKVPYLNGGIFAEHQIEKSYGAAIEIPDAAFARLISFFEQYHWHLDDRPLGNDSEINPDVLGYIFEKYINQKQMGAYYTKEDITEYISRNTIVPFLFDTTQHSIPSAFKPGGPIWSLPVEDPDRYIFPAMQKGKELVLPAGIAAGIDDVARRGGWNAPADDGYGLPTEIWRETVARRQRYEEVRTLLAAGKVTSINDFVTYNLDIRQLAQDAIEQTEDPALLRLFWQSVSKVTILDPTCGSGAFLFAALNVLEPLYEACLGRMESMVDALPPGGSPEKLKDFRQVLDEVARHPNERYFIYKSIIVQNLYGVDLMHEAVEIAKLRLFLELVALIEDVNQMEPLPDIDFNIRAGNTLVGFATQAQMEDAVRGDRLLLLPEDEEELAEIRNKAADVDRLFGRFRALQTADSTNDFAGEYAATKLELQKRLAALAGQLDRLLAQQYGVSPDSLDFERWRKSHQPLHWFAEFYGIVHSRGGFDAVIGNPPYVELKAVTEYQLLDTACKSAGNLYALAIETCSILGNQLGRQGFIVPVSSISTDRYTPLQRILTEKTLHYSSYDDRPSRLFEGLEHVRLTIHLIAPSKQILQLFSTRYHKWVTAERKNLFQNLTYTASKPLLIGGSIPKLCHAIEKSILAKLSAQSRSLGSYCVPFSSHSVYYSRKVGYFLQILDFEPIVLDGEGQRRAPSEFKRLDFANAATADVALCCLNSNLFYWFVTVFSDCRHVNRREVVNFPVDMHRILDVYNESEYSVISEALMDELRRTSQMRIMRFAHDTLTVQSIIPKRSKPLIDRIDHLLAQHFGFTEKEVDFLINYDIKYRMGDALSEEVEDED